QSTSNSKAQTAPAIQTASKPSAQATPSGWEQFWRKSLHDGVIANTQAKPLTAVPRSDATSQPSNQPQRTDSEFEIVFRPDPTIHDGRFSNNGWLQELPKPITKLTWDNAAIMNPGDAYRLGVVTGGMVELTYGGRRLQAPVWIQPGHVPGSVTLHLGYGRTQAGRAGTGVGFNP